MIGYQLILNHYKSFTAVRSGIKLMNHIDEGIKILQDHGADDFVIEAFCIHPLLQLDTQLVGLFSNLNDNLLLTLNPKVLILTMEYRKVANAYLCKPETDDWTIDKIRFSCPLVLDDVRLMLIADKVQNYKDFLTYHSSTHLRKIQLKQYFENWLKYLDCEEYFHKFRSLHGQF